MSSSDAAAYPRFQNTARALSSTASASNERGLPLGLGSFCTISQIILDQLLFCAERYEYQLTEPPYGRLLLTPRLLAGYPHRAVRGRRRSEVPPGRHQRRQDRSRRRLP